MSKEKIFNIFPIVINDIISSIGYKSHFVDGDDDFKIKFLQKTIDDDRRNLKFVEVPEGFDILKGKNKRAGISLFNYNNLVLNNQVAILFEKVFEAESASKVPLFIATLLDENNIRVDKSVKIKPIDDKIFKKTISEEIPEDYLIYYFTENGFDFSNLLNDDFLRAPKLLFQNELYVSSIKLLLSAIDSFAFLEYGDSKNIFKKWIDTYCEINKVGINSDELWEYRNSLLHMTNNKSRKVNQNKVAPLSFYVTQKKDFIPTAGNNLKFFNLLILIEIIAKGLEKWILTYNDDRKKIEKFIERYDLIISDVRHSKTFIKD